MRVEEKWCEGVYKLPAIRPVYDWDLDRWIRARFERDGHHRGFYKSARWRRLRAKVLEECHGESIYELSLTPARYEPASTVHHVMRISEAPGWGLSEWAVDDGGRVVRNLIPLSHAAHDLAHDRRFGARTQLKPPPITEEWW